MIPPAFTVNFRLKFHFHFSNLLRSTFPNPLCFTSGQLIFNQDKLPYHLSAGIPAARTRYWFCTEIVWNGMLFACLHDFHTSPAFLSQLIILIKWNWARPSKYFAKFFRALLFRQLKYLTKAVFAIGWSAKFRSKCRRRKIICCLWTAAYTWDRTSYRSPIRNNGRLKYALNYSGVKFWTVA